MAVNKNEPGLKKVSSLGYALLCLLARRDRSGYELALFTSPPRNYLLWSARHSQIYPELAKLTAAGLVEFSHVAQESRPDKKVYRLTTRGKRNLRDWILQKPRATPFRQELNLKSHACWLADPEDAAGLFREQAETARAEIALIEQHRDELWGRTGEEFPPRASSPLFGTYANIRFAIDSREHLIEWCEWMEGELLAEVTAKSASKKHA
jgi:DNA-binding PadR family transcriptional regulator